MRIIRFLHGFGESYHLAVLVFMYCSYANIMRGRLIHVVIRSLGGSAQVAVTSRSRLRPLHLLFAPASLHSATTGDT